MWCKKSRWFRVSVLAMLIFASFGCEPAQEPDKETLEGVLNTTIGSLGSLYQAGAIPVRGFGIVAGLSGTGSAECPPMLREILVKYMQKQLTGQAQVDPDRFINSRNTAVVEIYGVIPSLALKGEHFDVKVTALSRTQTTSLEGGHLYTVDLKAITRIAGTELNSKIQDYSLFSKILATAQGSVFVDKLDGPSPNGVAGYVLGGGRAIENVRLSLVLNQSNYMAASTIRNRLNERFGSGIAKALSPSEILLKIPAKYTDDKQRFLEMIRLLYLAENYDLQQKRIRMLTQNLAESEEKLAAEIALEAIGKAAATELSALLKSTDRKTRFHAARCILMIGDDRGLAVLRSISRDKNSPRRIEAIKAIGSGARRKSAIAILSRLLGDTDFKARLAAYEQLRKLEDISISKMVVGGDIVVDSVVYRGPKVVYVSRAESPQIILFGSPIFCQRDIFVKSDDGSIVVNAAAKDKYISLLRKHPTRPKVIGPLRSTFKLTDVISSLADSAVAEKTTRSRPGLGVPYSDLIALLRRMCDSGAVKATFIADDLTTVGTNM